MIRGLQIDAGMVPVYEEFVSSKPAHPRTKVLRRMSTPGCKCHAGYSGYASQTMFRDSLWNFKECYTRKMMCPSGADDRTHPRCDCNNDRRGTITWSFEQDKYIGKCKIRTPDDLPPQFDESWYDDPGYARHRSAAAANPSEEFCRKCERAYSDRAVGRPLSREITRAELDKAFKKAAIKLHPDRTRDVDQEERARLEELFKVVNNCHTYKDERQVEKNYVDCCVPLANRRFAKVCD
jgi:hypothetical protein